METPINSGESSKTATMLEKPCWKRASGKQKENYSFQLDQKLKKIKIPKSVVDCDDIHCKKSDHCSDADEFMIDILDCVEASSFENLPITKPSSKKPSGLKSMPGWSESVKPFRDTAFFWFQVWKSAGCPHNTKLQKS